MSARRRAGRRWPLWVQLSLLNALIAALALGGGGTLLLRNLERRLLEERAEALLAQAHTAADLVSVWQRSLVTPSLTLVLYRFHQEVGIRPVFIGPDSVAVADSWDPSPVVGKRMTQPEVARALAGDDTTGVRRLDDGTRVMYGVVPVPRGDDVAGAVLLSDDLSAVDAALADHRRQLLLVAPAAGLLAILAGVALARYLTRPLTQLSRAARTFAGGSLDVRVEPGGSQEMAELGTAFNQMALGISRLDQQRRAFVANASHELRTPVAAVRALAEGLLVSQGDLSRYRTYLEQIVQECDRSARLVDRMLELARLDARVDRGRTEEPADLVQVVDEVVAALQPLARERGVTLEWLSGAPAEARVDPRLVETVIGNLVENGLKYTPRGGKVSVQITAATGEWRLTVSDTGLGIPEEHLPHIFERFYRVDKMRARSTGGAGLGLAIAAEAAKLLGGRLEVESRPGVGSRFTLFLPK